MSRIAALLLALPALGLYTTASADVPNTSALAATNTGCSDSHDGPGVTSASVNCGTGSATANADYGLLSATAAGGNFGVGHGIAGFVDWLVIMGGTGTGTFSVDLSLDGSVSGTTGSSAEVILSGAINHDEYYHSGAFHETFGSGPVAFTFGQPFQFTEGLTQGVSVATIDDSASAASSATLVDWVVLDANGVPVDKVTVIGQSGHIYVPPVPEPSTWALLCAGALLLLVRRRRKA